MNKSKKIIGMALSACLCVSMLAGCGSNNKTETSKSDSKKENSETKKTMVIGILHLTVPMKRTVQIHMTHIPDGHASVMELGRLL